MTTYRTPYPKPRPFTKTSVKWLARVARQKCAQLNRAKKAYDQAYTAFLQAASVAAAAKKAQGHP